VLAGAAKLQACEQQTAISVAMGTGKEASICSQLLGAVLHNMSWSDTSELR